MTDGDAFIPADCRLDRRNTFFLLHEHFAICKICRRTRRPCDSGQYLTKLAAIVERTRVRNLFVPLDVS